MWIVKLKDATAPFLYSLRLPPGVVEDVDRVNTFFDERLNRFVIPKESTVTPNNPADNSLDNNDS